jgi:hypothetical protein
VAVHGNDIFVVCDWRNAAGLMQSVRPERMVYLLQNDERLFAPAAEDFVRCSEIMGNDRLRFVVDSRLLYDHMLAQGFQNLREHGEYFEPACPLQPMDPEYGSGRRKRTFLFHGSPANRNELYYRGLEAIEEAVLCGALSGDKWELHFLDLHCHDPAEERSLPRIVLRGGEEPVIHRNPNWPDYAELLRSADLGMALVCSPHPGYPVLQMAAAGAVVITNRFHGKESLEAYATNIFCAEPSVADLVSAIGKGAELAADVRIRSENCKSSRIFRDWKRAFAGVLRTSTREVGSTGL